MEAVFDPHLPYARTDGLERHVDVSSMEFFKSLLSRDLHVRAYEMIHAKDLTKNACEEIVAEHCPFLVYTYSCIQNGGKERINVCAFS